MKLSTISNNMRLSKSIKNTLGNNEDVKKIFSFGNRHIYIRLILSLIKWLLIAIAAGAVIVILYQIGETASKGMALPVFNQSNWLSSQNSENIWPNFILRISIISSLLFALIFSPVLLFYHLYFLRTANTFVMTDRRIIVKRGWLNTSVKSVNYDRITDVSVEQSFLDKIFYGSGTLSVSTAGGDGYELELNCVSHPHELKKNLYDLKEEYRRQIYPSTENQKQNEISQSI
jgi:membrane protein YdbS with pleckstrin-like domain